MARLWKNDPATPEGKYPIVLRRDGSVLTSRYLVITLRDPAASVAFSAYADEAEQLGYDDEYVADIRKLANDANKESGVNPGDPLAPRHRQDDPAILAWAHTLGNPGGDQTFGSGR